MVSEPRVPWEIVDLGSKLGLATREFIKNGGQYYGRQVRNIKHDRCLCVDKKEKYTKHVEKTKMVYEHADILEHGWLEARMPRANYFLMWDFLEHLPTLADAKKVMKYAIYKAEIGVWIRMPSFEPDKVTGEGRLRKMGLRFCWSHWKGHKTHWLLKHVDEVLEELRKEGYQLSVKIKPNQQMSSTKDKRIVPIDAPIDTKVYRPEQGHKTIQNLTPRVVGQWEVIIKVHGRPEI